MSRRFVRLFFFYYSLRFCYHDVMTRDKSIERRNKGYKEGRTFDPFFFFDLSHSYNNVSFDFMPICI